MLRVASVARTLPTPATPGAGVFVLRRLAAMAAQSDVRILQPVPCAPLLRPLPGWARAPNHVAEGQVIHHAAMFYLPGLLKSLDGRWLERSVLPQLRRWQAQKPIDLVEAHFGYPDGVGAVRAARRLGVPVFVTIRGFEAERVGVSRVGDQIVAALNAATGCISVSHSLRATMVAHGVSADRIVVIPNAVDRSVFRPGDRMVARRALGLPAHGHLVISVGHLVTLKRHDVVLRAIATLRARGIAASLAVVGGVDYEPEHPAALHQLASELGISAYVNFVGAIPPTQIAAWLRAANVFALGTRREGCCNAILEALAVGIPVVTTPVGDNPHYVIPGVNGDLVAVGDVAAMTDSLQAILHSDWDAGVVSAALPVGDWPSVGRAVLDYFRDRLQ
jgi:glycosyltransferase involved in cell wall biosynthesis